MVGVTLDPGLSIHPGKDLLKELVGVARSYTELGDPDGLVKGLVELGEVVLEVLSVVSGVVVGDDEVDLAAVAGRHELLKVVDSLVGLVGVGDGRRADTEALRGEGLDERLVGRGGSSDVDVGASTTNLVGLVEAQHVRNLIVLLGVGDVGVPALSAPLLVGVEKRNIFEVEGCSVDDCLPVVHPGDLGAGELVSPLRSGNTVVVLGEGKTTFASTTCLERRCLDHRGEASKGQNEGRGKHNE